MLCPFLNIGQWTKSRNVVIIIHVIHHCQNCSELICTMSVDQVCTPCFREHKWLVVQWLRIALSVRPSWTTTFSPFCLPNRSSFWNVLFSESNIKVEVQAHQHYYITSTNYGAKMKTINPDSNMNGNSDFLKVMEFHHEYSFDLLPSFQIIWNATFSRFLLIVLCYDFVLYSSNETGICTLCVLLGQSP